MFQSLVYSEAKFSNCGLYRISLLIRISPTNRKVLFIGLNPSIANESIHDPTTKRLIGFCKAWDYGTLLVVNLFSRVGSSPKILKHTCNPVGELNDIEIKKRLSSWAYDPYWDLWLGWGANGKFKNRNLEVLDCIKHFWKIRSKNYPHSKGPLTIGLTKGGEPKHPLYLSRNLVLRPFDCCL